MAAVGRFLSRHLNKYWKRLLFFAVAPWILIEILMAIGGQGNFLIVLYTISNTVSPHGGLTFLGILFGFTILLAAAMAATWPFNLVKKN